MGLRQKGATITGAGTLEKTGNSMLIFGGGGQVNIAMDAGSWIHIKEGEIKAHDNVQANWDNNKASLRLDAGTIFGQVEGNVTVGALEGAGTVLLGYDNFRPVMNIGYGDASAVFTGNVQEDRRYSANTVGAMTKIGRGTQTLAGTNNWFRGNMTVNDGILNFSNTGNLMANALWIGNTAGSRGRVEVGNGNVITTLNNADRVGVVLGDNGGTGALYQSGGSLLIQSGPDVDNFIIGRSANSYGYFEVSGGTNRLSEFGVGSGYGGNGMMSVLGGEITVTNYFNIGRADSVNGQVGIVNLTGGSVRALNNSYDTTLAVGNATGKNTVMTVGANG
ncbi:MAG: hypothetical protein EB088_15085, partial [Betaproteobacteria bacterium]|nr:hypothetical protein [Betaproteobacteria bacterium]